MGKLLFFLEKDTIQQSQGEACFLPTLSHDAHLMQMAEAALYGGHDVYLAPIDAFGPDVIVTKLLELAPFSCPPTSSQPASALQFDLVFCAYPDVHQRSYFPGAKTVAYFPALYFVEMPDHFMTGRMYYLMRTLQWHVDFFVFQNDRQADFMDIFARALAGIDIRPNTFHMPYGVPSNTQPFNAGLRAAKRAAYGIGKDDVVLLHGGGAWRWTDFERFLTQYIQLVSEQPQSCLKLIIPGLSQKANSDHNEYIARVHAMLMQHAHLLSPNQQWSIMYEQDWQAASQKMPDFQLISDIGVSTSPMSLEYHLSHRVRVIDYIASGMGLLLSYGDKFSSMPELQPISYVADGAKPNGYRIALERIIAGGFTSRLATIEAGASARLKFRNGPTKLAMMEKMMATTPVMPTQDCPINYVFHSEKVSTLKGVFKQFFAASIPT